MGRIFEFGDYWDTATFVLYLLIGYTVSRLARCGAEHSEDRKRGICGGIKCSKADAYYFMIFLLLSFFYAFRSADVGSDTPYYVQNFQNIDNFSFDLQRFLIFKQNEPFFEIFTLVMRKITSNFTVYFLVISFILAYAYVCFIRMFWKKDTNTIFLIAFVIGYQYNMNAMRSALAGAFLILSFCAIEERKIKKAVILTMAGSMFHYTVLVNLGFIVFYCIVCKKGWIKKRKVFLILIVAAVFALICLPAVSDYLLKTRYRIYIHTDSPSFIGQWDIILVCLLAFHALKKDHKGNARLNTALSAAMFCLLLIIPAVFLGAYRLTGYYELPRFFLCDHLLGRTRITNKKILKTGLYIITILYILFKMGRNSIPPGFRYHFLFL